MFYEYWSKMERSAYGGYSTQWRWHLKAANGRIIATSGEGYNNESDCVAAIALVKGSSAAPVRKVA